MLGLEPGLPGIVCLLACSLVGPSIGTRVARDHASLPAALVTLSVTCATTSSVFFAWALYTTLTDSLDAGVVTFSLALLASLYGAGCCCSVQRWAYRILTTASYAAVALNYVVVALDATDVFLLYLLVGAVWWLNAAVLSTCVDTARRNAGGIYEKIPQ